MLTLYESESLRVVLMEACEAAPLLQIFSEVADELRWDLGGVHPDSTGDCRYFAGVKSGRVVGGLQLVLGNDVGLPLMRTWPEIQLCGRLDVADLTLLAFARDQRGDLEMLYAVCVEMWRYCVQEGVSEVWAELTTRSLKIYRRMGWPFEVMGEFRPYLGEGCAPCRMIVADAHDVAFARAGASTRVRQALQQALRGTVNKPTPEAGSGGHP